MVDNGLFPSVHALFAGLCVNSGLLYIIGHLNVSEKLTVPSNIELLFDFLLIPHLDANPNVHTVFSVAF